MQEETEGRGGRWLRGGWRGKGEEREGGGEEERWRRLRENVENSAERRQRG